MEGIPAIYIQNLLGSKNDIVKLKLTKLNRSINRRNWNFEEIKRLVREKNSLLIVKSTLQLKN